VPRDSEGLPVGKAGDQRFVIAVVDLGEVVELVDAERFERREEPPVARLAA
jgi:hypothetical protein